MWPAVTSPHPANFDIINHDWFWLKSRLSRAGQVSVCLSTGLSMQVIPHVSRAKRIIKIIRALKNQRHFIGGGNK